MRYENREQTLDCICSKFKGHVIPAFQNFLNYQRFKLQIVEIPEIKIGGNLCQLCLTLTNFTRNTLPIITPNSQILVGTSNIDMCWNSTMNNYIRISTLIIKKGWSFFLLQFM